MLCENCLKKNVCMDWFRIRELVRVLQFAEIEVKSCKEFTLVGTSKVEEKKIEEEKEEEGGEEE